MIHRGGTWSPPAAWALPTLDVQMEEIVMSQQDPHRQPSRFTVEIDGLDLSRKEVDDILNEITKVAAERVKRHKAAATSGGDDLRFGQWGSFAEWGSFGQVVE